MTMNTNVFNAKDGVESHVEQQFGSFLPGKKKNSINGHGKGKDSFIERIAGS